MARSTLSKAKERAKDASIAETLDIMPGSALNRPRAKAKARAKLTTDCVIIVASPGHISRNCPNTQKGKGKGKAVKGSYYGGKSSWASQQWD